MDNRVYALFVKHEGQDWKQSSKLYVRRHNVEKRVPYYLVWVEDEQVWINTEGTYRMKIMYADLGWRD